MVEVLTFVAFLMVFVRIIAMIGTVTIFFPSGTPNIAKVGLGLLISIIITPMIDVTHLNGGDLSTLAFVMLIGKEAIFGLILGFIVNLIVNSFQMAGQFMDFSMGFSMASIFDPQSGENVTILGRIMYWMCIAVYILADGPHLLIRCLIDSFTAVPVGMFELTNSMATYIVQVIFQFFTIGLKVAVPIIIILLITDIVLGLAARVMPQLNAMVLSMPIKIIVGLVTVSILLPFFIKIIGTNFAAVKDIFNEIFKLVPIMMVSFAADSGDKTEKPTPKKLSDARKKGQVAKSKELSSAIGLVGATIIIALLSSFIISTLKTALTMFLGSYLNYEITSQSVLPLIIRALIFLFLIFIASATPVLVLGVVGNIAQTGFIHTTESLKPKLEKLNPISGFKRMFSMRAVVDLIKNLAIIGVIGYIGYSYVKDNYYLILNMGEYKISAIITEFGELIKGVFLKVTLALVVIGVIDFVYQKFQHNKELKMSKQEIKEEYKQQEGDPQIKGKRRQKHREMAMHRMMQAVPDATVVITNPTHIAVALKYEENSGKAPILVAKGNENVALKIKEKAIESGVPIIENKPLARAIFKDVELDKEIPADMYKAVAEILVLVMNMKK